MSSSARFPVCLRLASIIAGLVVSGASAQVGPPPAKTAAAGIIVDLGAGSTVRLPPEWTATESNDGFIFLPPGVRFDPKGTENPEVYILAVRDDYDPSEEAQTVKQLSTAVGATGGSGGQRQVLTFGTRPGAVYRWMVRDPKSAQQTALDIYVVPDERRAVVLIAAGRSERVRAQDASVVRILSSLASASPAPETGGPLADATPLAQRWLQKLQGKMVRQFWASQGMSSDKRHWLNADGTYAFKSSSMVSVDVSGASGLSTGRGDSTGRWRIRDVSGKAFLEVRYNNGNVSRMAITEDNRNWYLNGEKAFAVNPD